MPEAAELSSYVLLLMLLSFVVPVMILGEVAQYRFKKLQNSLAQGSQMYMYQP